MPKDADDIRRTRAVKAWELVKQHRSVTKAAAAIKTPRTTLSAHYRAAINEFGYAPVTEEQNVKIDTLLSEESSPAERKDIRDAAFWRKKSVELQRQLGDAEHLYEQLAGIRQQQVTVPDWLLRRDQGKPGRAVLGLLISDVHAGERVSREELNGINEYNIAICRERLRRLFAAACEIGPRWMADCKCEGALLALGGDLISGDLHLELTQTNELTSHDQVKFIVEEITAGIKHLLAAYGRVHVASVPGNHGRTTIKPTAKLYSRLSYDTLAADMVADRFAGDKRVTFQIGASTDQLIPVFGRTVLLSHGDKLGSGGGQGFAGPDLPIVRGGKKVREQQASVGRKIDLILRGHLHFSTHPGKILSNGSVVGVNEYAADLRGEVQTPRQWLFLLHSKWGLRERLDVQLEDPAEPEKPRVRVPAAMARP
jgi:hypothetical protein